MDLAQMGITDFHVFVVALVVLFIAGCSVLYINYHTESRKQRYLRQITVTLWGFEPDPSKTKTSEFYWQWRKLFLSGLMLSSLIISCTVTTVHIDVALQMSGGFMAIWLAFITGFWYLDVLPKLQKNMSEDGNTSVSSITVEEVKQTGAPDANKSDVKGERKLPVTIVTGYLGAGKTTLVKHILSNTSGYKVLVIENEIGDEGVDHELLLQHTKKENIILMNNGCICCTVRKDIVDTFHMLLANKDILAAIDWVVIETTGLADPAPLILSLYMDSLCKSRLRLDGVLAVVDAVNLKYHLGLGDGVRGNALGAAAHPAIGRGEKKENEVIKQLAYADRVMLNKVDLLSAAVGAADRSVEESLEDIKRAIEVINPRVAVLPCSRGNVPISELLDINAFDALKSGEMLLNAEFCQPINITRLNSRSKNDGKVGASPKITKNFNSKQRNPSLGMPNLMRLPSKSRNVVQTCSLIVQSPLSLDAVNVWLLSLLQTSGEDVYRIKGILDVADHPEQFVVQGVHMMFDGVRGRLWRPEETRKSVLVFIGVKLDEFQLQQEFDACTVRSLEEAKQKK